MRSFAASILGLALAGCTGLPDGVEAVDDFELDRYLGTWYEIARLDHRFERGLSNVQARYALREDGGVRVLNRGYDAAAGEWRDAEGKAYFIGERDTGRLKVSFFGPFYGAYNIIDLADDYSHAMISGPNRKYLWILAREPKLAPQVLERLLQRAKQLGFDTGSLIYPEHESPGARG